VPGPLQWPVAIAMIVIGCLFCHRAIKLSRTPLPKTGEPAEPAKTARAEAEPRVSPRVLGLLPACGAGDGADQEKGESGGAAEDGDGRGHGQGASGAVGPGERGDEAADEELGEAEQGRGGPRVRAVVVQGEGGRVRQYEADARNHDDCGCAEL